MRRIPLALALSLALAAPASAEAAVLNVDPAGSDASTCTTTSPCRSLGRAYTVAASGDTVAVKTGIYPRQDIPSGTKYVTFQGEPNTIVRQMFISAANTTFDGINVDANGAQTVNGAALEPNAPNITFKNAYVGNVTDEKGALSGSECNGCVYDNVSFRDVRIATDGVHNECMYSMSPNITVRNSRFTNCATMDIFFTRGTWWGQPYYGGFTLTNNFFGKTYMLGGAVHYYTIQWGDVGGGTIANATIRNNTFELPAAAAGTFTNSYESCNSPALNLAGLTLQTCSTTSGSTSTTTTTTTTPPPPPPPPPADTTTTTTTPPPPPPPPPADTTTTTTTPSGLVGAWNFNESSGTVVSDKSGIGNSGTIYGAARTSKGKYGRAVSFDGLNDYISIPDASSLDLKQGMTLEAWVYATSATASRQILMKENRAAGMESYAFYAAANDTSKPSVEVATGPSYTSQIGSQAISTSTWTHIAATYDGAQIRIYKNGVLIGSRALTGDLVATSDPLKIGGSAIWSEFFKGRIDEVRVWNTVRSASQIGGDMNTPI